MMNIYLYTYTSIFIYIYTYIYVYYKFPPLSSLFLSAIKREGGVRGLELGTDGRKRGEGLAKYSWRRSFTSEELGGGWVGSGVGNTRYVFHRVYVCNI